MLNKALRGKKKWIATSVVGVVSAAIISGVIYNSSNVAIAKASLPKIEDIAMRESPFTVLEIVPKYEDARFGYLVGGQEPAFVVNGADVQNRVLSLDDMVSKDERDARYPKEREDLSSLIVFDSGVLEGEDKAYTWTDGFAETTEESSTEKKINAKTIYGSYEGAINGDYKKNDEVLEAYKEVGAPGNLTIEQVLDPSNTDSKGQLHMDIASFDPNVGNQQTGRYALGFVKFNEETDRSPFAVQVTYSDESKSGTYYDFSYYIPNEDHAFVGEPSYSHDEEGNPGDITGYVISNATLANNTALYNINGDYVSYYGYTKLDESDAENPTLMFVDYQNNEYPVEGGVDSLAYKISESNLNLYSFKILQDVTTAYDNVYIINSAYESAAGFATCNLYDKSIVLEQGQEPVKYGIYIDDDYLRNHTYYYMGTDVEPYLYVGTPDSEGNQGSQDGTVNFVQNFMGTEQGTFRYTGGFTNNEWFKQWVLDRVFDPNNSENDQCSYTNVDVKTLTADSVTVDDINKADLIYIQGVQYSQRGNDISAEVAQEILKAVPNNSKPVILEGYGLYNDIYSENDGIRTGANGEPLDDLYKLVLGLSQYDLDSDSVDAYIKAMWEETEATKITENNNLYQKTNFSKIRDLVYTNTTLFMYNPVGSVVGDNFLTTILDSSSFDSYKTRKFNKDLGEIAEANAIAKDKEGPDEYKVWYELGFKDVIDDINTELFYLKIAELDEEQSGFNSKISIATCIRHIIAFGDRRVTSKDQLRVLDLEPFYSEVYEEHPTYFENMVVKKAQGEADMLGRRVFTYENLKGTYTYDETKRDIITKKWLMDNIGTQITDPKQIEITGMSTREFIGNIQELKSDFDLIYIGLDTQYMNTEMESDNTVKTNKTLYNDESMNGLVYTHVGDYLALSNNYVYVNGVPGHDGGRGWLFGSGSDTKGNIRSSGNDITYEKLRDLMAYVKAGYAVLLSNDFYTYDKDGHISGVNIKKIDKGSYMYDFALWVLYGDKYATEEKFENGFIGKNVSVKGFFEVTSVKSTPKNENEASVDVIITNNVKDDNLDAYVDKTILQNKENYSQFLNISKLKIVFKKDSEGHDIKPTAYYDDITTSLNDPTGKLGNYLEKDAYGFYNLNFSVSLENYAATNTEETTYNCKLFIDHDADGRYEALEELTGLTITDGSNNSVEMDGNVYKLRTGNEYNISRRVPEGYVGFLSWKLVFYENGRVFTNLDDSSENLVEASETGYSAVPDFTMKPQIKILQIMQHIDVNSGGSGDASLDLNSDAMQALYTQVRDFDIKVEQIQYKELARNRVIKDGEETETRVLKPGESILDFFMNYDMLVMGFNDQFYYAGYEGYWADSEPKGATAQQNMAVVLAVREYALAGKSILFTHDLNSYSIQDGAWNKNSWGWYSNRYLRDVQGMDRYGNVKNYLSELQRFAGTTKLTEYVSRYDDDDSEVYKDIWGANSEKTYNRPGLAKDKFFGSSAEDSINQNMLFGWNDTNSIRYLYEENTNGTYGYANTCLASVYDNTTPGAPFYESNQTHVTKVNSGQITEYPFHIEDELLVAPTHAQYFQLNLDTDSKDKNYDDDVVVWYAISNKNTELTNDKEAAWEATDKVNYFTADYNDVRNNYYIYNKGNITYTGSGHSMVNGDAEMKLFVNTLVAAYNAGDHAPVARYKQSGSDNSADITSMYEPFDLAYLNGYKADGSEENKGNFVEGNITVYFKVVNNNIRNNVSVDDNGNLNYMPINVQYYLKSDSSDYQFVIGDPNISEDDKDDAGKAKAPEFYKTITPISVTPVVNSNGEDLVGADALDNKYKLENYYIYKAEFDIDDFGGFSAVGKTNRLNVNNGVIYIRMTADQPDKNGVIKDWGNVEVLPASQSMNPLSINFIDLVELR